MKNTRIIVLSVLLMAGLYGCAGLKETTRGFVGISTKDLEERRQEALRITFQHDYSSCYKKIIEVLRLNKCYIYTSDPKKDLIAIYMSETDTTPVGIFLTSQNKDTTLIEVSSPSIYAKETITKIVYTAFDAKPLNLSKDKDEEEKVDLKKMFGN